MYVKKHTAVIITYRTQINKNNNINNRRPLLSAAAVANSVEPVRVRYICRFFRPSRLIIIILIMFYKNDWLHGQMSANKYINFY